MRNINNIYARLIIHTDCNGFNCIMSTLRWIYIIIITTIWQNIMAKLQQSSTLWTKTHCYKGYYDKQHYGEDH